MQFIPMPMWIQTHKQDKHSLDLLKFNWQLLMCSHTHASTHSHVLLWLFTVILSRFGLSEGKNKWLTFSPNWKWNYPQEQIFFKYLKLPLNEMHLSLTMACLGLHLQLWMASYIFARMVISWYIAYYTSHENGLQLLSHKKLPLTATNWNKLKLVGPLYLPCTADVIKITFTRLANYRKLKQKYQSEEESRLGENCKLKCDYRSICNEISNNITYLTLTSIN